MALTGKQKKQIRFMVSCNPTMKNMERISNLTDEEALSELENFKEKRLKMLSQEQIQLSLEQTTVLERLTSLNELVELLGE